MNSINKREITYLDVSPYAAQSAAARINSSQVQDFSDPQKLFEEDRIFRKLQSCEHNYTALDGSYGALRNGENTALWSRMQSAAGTRLLSPDVTLEITFGGLQNSPGLAFKFDTQNNTWCDMLRARWHRGNTLLSDQMFYPGSPEYTCRNRVELYDRITVDFMRMNLPGRFLRVEHILFGIVRVFGDGELESLTINEGYDPTGRTLFINSAGFTVNTKDPLAYIFMKRQPLHIKYNGELMGTYYIDKSRKYADRRYSIEAVDKIGVLDASDDFMGGIYTNIPAKTLLNNIMGGIFDLEIDASLENIPINGWLPVMKRREALAQVAVAVGAMIDTSRSGAVMIRPVPDSSDNNNAERVIDKDRVYQSGYIDVEFPCTGIELIEHSFTAGTEIKELYKDILTGEKTVMFSEPVSDLTITNGTIISSGANFAVIRGTGAACTLRGRPYIDVQSSVVIKSGEFIEGTQEKIEKIADCWLVNKNNSQKTAQRLFEYYQRKSVFDGDFLMDGEKIGDHVKIASFFSTDSNDSTDSNEGFISGQIEKLSVYPGSKNIKARGIIRGD